MARFIAYVKGQRGEASRLGTKSSGIRTQAQGWDIGGFVTVRSNGSDEDVVCVTITRGSNGYGHDLCLGCFKIKDGEIIKLGEED